MKKMNSSLLSLMFFAAPDLWYSVFAVFAALIFWGAAEYVRLLQEKRRNYFIRRDRDRYEETLYACRDGYFAFIYPDDRVNDAASGISERCSRRLAVLLNLDGGVDTPFAEVLRCFYKDDADKIAKYVALLKEDGVSFEDRFDLKNGRKLILNGVRISGADGSVYSDVVWFRDISYIAVKIDALQNEKQEKRTYRCGDPISHHRRHGWPSCSGEFCHCRAHCGSPAGKDGEGPLWGPPGGCGAGRAAGILPG